MKRYVWILVVIVVVSAFAYWAFKSKGPEPVAPPSQEELSELPEDQPGEAVSEEPPVQGGDAGVVDGVSPGAGSKEDAITRREGLTKYVEAIEKIDIMLKDQLDKLEKEGGSEEEIERLNGEQKKLQQALDEAKAELSRTE